MAGPHTDIAPKSCAATLPACRVCDGRVVTWCVSIRPQERQATRVAVSEGLEESARLAHVAAAHAAKLKQQGWEEKQQLAKDKRLSFNQKVRRRGLAPLGKSGGRRPAEWDGGGWAGRGRRLGHWVLGRGMAPTRVPPVCRVGGNWQACRRSPLRGTD